MSVLTHSSPAHTCSPTLERDVKIRGSEVEDALAEGCPIPERGQALRKLVERQQVEILRRMGKRETPLERETRFGQPLATVLGELGDDLAGDGSGMS